MQFAHEQTGTLLLDNKCGFNLLPEIELVLPENIHPSSIVWKDNLNRTFYLDSTIVQLPPLAELRESSDVGSSTCRLNCPDSYTVKLAEADGKHAKATIRIVRVTIQEYVMDIEYTHYSLDRIYHTKETRSAQLTNKSGSSPSLLRSVSIIDNETWMHISNGTVQVSSSEFPDVGCSHQWTIAFLLQVRITKSQSM